MFGFIASFGEFGTIWEIGNNTLSKVNSFACTIYGCLSCNNGDISSYANILCSVGSSPIHNELTRILPKIFRQENICRYFSNKLPGLKAKLCQPSS